MSLSHRSTSACARLIPPISQVNGESSQESHQYCLSAAPVSAVPVHMVGLDISFWASQVINSLMGPWGGISFALQFDCKEQKRPNFKPFPVVGIGVSSLMWWLAHVALTRLPKWERNWARIYLLSVPQPLTPVQSPPNQKGCFYWFSLASSLANCIDSSWPSHRLKPWEGTGGWGELESSDYVFPTITIS